MRLLRIEENGEVSLTKKLFDDDIPPYAILSHTWGEDEDEVLFEDLRSGQIDTSSDGWAKVDLCKHQAVSDGLDYFWIDTICIDRSSSAEVSEAINSMFHWYREAEKCYVYLSDVSFLSDGTSVQSWASALRIARSRWFRRGFTLQELLAPSIVEFFAREGDLIGTKTQLAAQLSEITGIPLSALEGAALSNFTIEERMSWAKGRSTRRREDGAYCLMGIFDVHMPLIYGEREKAFARLQDEIRRSTQAAEDQPWARRQSMAEIEQAFKSTFSLASSKDGSEDSGNVSESSQRTERMYEAMVKGSNVSSGDAGARHMRHRRTSRRSDTASTSVATDAADSDIGQRPIVEASSASIRSVSVTGSANDLGNDAVLRDIGWAEGLSPTKRQASETNFRGMHDWPFKNMGEAPKYAVCRVADTNWGKGRSLKEILELARRERHQGNWPPSKHVPILAYDQHWHWGLAFDNLGSHITLLQGEDNWPPMKLVEPPWKHKMTVELTEDGEWGTGLSAKERHRLKEELKKENNWPPMKPVPIEMVEDSDWDFSLSGKEQRRRVLDLLKDDKWPPTKRKEAAAASVDATDRAGREQLLLRTWRLKWEWQKQMEKSLKSCWELLQRLHAMQELEPEDAEIERRLVARRQILSIYRANLEEARRSGIDVARQLHDLQTSDAQ